MQPPFSLEKIAKKPPGFEKPGGNRSFFGCLSRLLCQRLHGGDFS